MTLESGGSPSLNFFIMKGSMAPYSTGFDPFQIQGTPQLFFINVANCAASQSPFLIPMSTDCLQNSPELQQQREILDQSSKLNSPLCMFQLPPSQCSVGQTRQCVPPTKPAKLRGQRTDTNLWGFAVVDVLHPFLSRIPVAPSAIAEWTKAVVNYNPDVVESSTKPCTSCICYSFQEEGNCELGSECMAFHIRRDYVNICRGLREPLCCALHNCFYSHEILHHSSVSHVTNRHFNLLLDANDNPYGAAPSQVDLSVFLFSVTTGLGALSAKENYCKFSQKRYVCRLHQEGRCKWTKDCGRIHVCRSLLAFLQSEEVVTFLKAIHNVSQTAQSLSQLISESSSVQSYIQSVVCVPLMKQLIDASHITALRALVAHRVAVTVEQAVVLQKGGFIQNLSDLRIFTLSPLIQRLLAPQVFSSGSEHSGSSSSKSSGITSI